MSDPSENSTVLVITKDVELLSSLLEGNTTDFEFHSRETMQEALQESDLLNNNHIVIIDIDSVPGGTAGIVEQTINLKKNDPTQVVMMIGEQEPLADILKSNIQPIIYRAFNKPVNPNQVFLSFGSASKVHQGLIEKQAAGEDILSVGPAENKTNIDSIAAQHKSKTPLYAGLGVLALGLIGFLVLSNNKSNNTIETTVTQVTTTTTEVDDTLVTTNDDVSNINQLNQEAAKALLEGRQISPPNDNALYYYNQVLVIDPYDLTAYEGKKSIVSELKNSFTNLVDNAEFDTALETVNTLQEIEPLDTGHIQLRNDLETAITSYVAELKNSGTQEEIERTTEVLAKLGPQSESSKAAAAALQNEKVLLANIDKAIDANNLIPPASGNAYTIVSQALQKNTISKVNFAPRISALSEKLVIEANKALDEKNLEESEKYTALVKRLDVDPENTALLETKLEGLKTAIAAEAEETAPEEGSSEELATEESEETTEETTEEVVVDKIIPAKIVSRSAPRYPSRAISREIEGWVDIGFTIDTDGKPIDIVVIDSEPSDTFDKAAINAVKKWRFSPAMNETTNETVTSVVDSTRLQFKLD